MGGPRRRKRRKESVGMAEGVSSFSIRLDKDTATLITSAEGREDWEIATVVHPDAVTERKGNDTARVDINPDGAALWVMETVMSAIANQKKIN